MYAIDQMIEALLKQLGPEKENERAKAIVERKEEEATFLATATPKEKDRMRGGGSRRGGGGIRGGGRGRGPRNFDQGHVDQVAARGGGGRGRGRVGENRAGGAHFPGPSGRGGVARGGPGARVNPSANGRTNAQVQNDIARFFPGNQPTRNAQQNAYTAAMARASASEGAGGSGMAAAMARVWARRQEGRAGAGGEERVNAGGVNGQTGGSAHLTTNEAQGGAIEISSGSEVGFRTES